MRVKKATIALLLIFISIVTLSDCSASILAVPRQSAPEFRQNAAAKAGTLEVNYIDVGQGDSIFIELPNRENMLIDAGNAENGAEIVSFIRSEGYEDIDYLIITHPHADHIGGMPEVISALDIGSVYMPEVSTDTSIYRKLVTALKSKGLTIHAARSGVKILDGNRFNIGIIAPVGGNYQDLNDYSAVVKLIYGSNSFLFMGDAEGVSENQITADVNTDVIKVGHHGADDSSTKAYIDKASPAYAIISVGTGNPYGHPSSVTLDTLRDAGAEIFRTDKAGTIVFTSDGKDISVNLQN